MIKFGVLGLGSDWDAIYHPALLSLRQRVQVRALFDPVQARALSAGKQLQAILCDSVTSLLSLKDLDAILVLNTSWYGQSLLPFLLNCKKPCFFTSNLDAENRFLQQVHLESSSQGQAFVPALPMRYTPVTNRLQELMATTLGRPLKVNAELYTVSNRFPQQDNTLNPNEQTQVSFYDWCQHILKSVPQQVSVRDSSSILIDYQSRTEKKATNSIQVQLVEKESSEGSEQRHPRINIQCEQGTVTLYDESHLEWQVDSKPVRESLSSERSAFEVMLDHFCRRVVGGLIPVTDMADYEKALALFRAAQMSFTQQVPISITQQAEA